MNEEQTKRLIPQDLDAEKSLLGAILISEESLPDIIEILKPDDFYDDRHRIIYGAMWTLYEKYRPIDILEVSN